MLQSTKNTLYRYPGAFAVIVLLVICSGCSRQETTAGRSISVTWEQLDTPTLPDAIQVFEGRDAALPLKAWHARIQLESEDIDIRVLVSRDADGRESVRDMAAAAGACLAVNGGFYRLDDDVARHIGFLVSNGVQIRGATRGIYSGNKRYDVARAAIGFTESDSGAIGWAFERADSVMLLDRPFFNSPGRPAELPLMDSLRSWRVHDALAAGPALVREGLVRPGVEDEVFYDPTLPLIHPRTAAGLTREGDLILMVVDGRQPSSRGVDLAELGRLMLEVGAWNALNLDGGSSSSFVLDHVMLNSPSGGTFHREVVSAIAVLCERTGK